MKILKTMAVATAALCLLAGCEETATIPQTELPTEPVVLKQFEEATGPKAIIKTTMGDIEVVLFPDEAPKAVENFLTHAENGYYDGVSFHRVIADFMIQGGDPLGNGTGGESIWGEAFEDEFSSNLRNFRGALSMANSGADTNGSQFFIVQADTASIVDVESMYVNEMYNAALARISEKSAELTEDELTAYIAEEQETLDKQIAEGAPEEYITAMQPIVDKYAEVGGTPHLDDVHTVFGHVISGMDVVDSIANAPKDANNMPTEPILINSIEVFE